MTSVTKCTLNLTGLQVNTCAERVLQSSAASSGPNERRQVLFLACGEDGCLDGQRETASRGEQRTGKFQ